MTDEPRPYASTAVRGLDELLVQLRPAPKTRERAATRQVIVHVDVADGVAVEHGGEPDGQVVDFSPNRQPFEGRLAGVADCAESAGQEHLGPPLVI